MSRLHVKHSSNFFIFLLLGFLCTDNLAGMFNLNKLVSTVKWKSDCTALFADSLEYALSNPPYGIRNKVVALICIELFYSIQKTKISFADKVCKVESVVLVFLCNINHKAEISIYKLIFCGSITGLCLLGKLNFFLVRNHRNFVDFFKIHSKNVFVVCHGIISLYTK